MTFHHVAAVVNPHSGGGATGRRVPEIEAALRACFDTVDIRLTTGPGDGIEQAHAARLAGADLVIAVGGDGTVHEVVNGLMRMGEPSTFAVMHAGTGGDFVKTLGTPTDVRGAAQRIATAAPRACDVMRCTFTDHEGATVVQFCVNVLGFGMNGEVVRRANASSKRLGGRLTFAWATVRALGAYRPPRVSVEWTDQDGVPGTWQGLLSSAFLANGARCGGGMRVGSGVLDDGVVDMSLIPDLPLHRTIMAAPRLYDGRLSVVKEVSTARVKTLRASAPNGDVVLLDLDGEQPGFLPLTADVLEKALFVAG